MFVDELSQARQILQIIRACGERGVAAADARFSLARNRNIMYSKFPLRELSYCFTCLRVGLLVIVPVGAYRKRMEARVKRLLLGLATTKCAPVDLAIIFTRARASVERSPRLKTQCATVHLQSRMPMQRAVIADREIRPNRSTR